MSRARLLFLQHSFLACSADQSDGFPDVAGRIQGARLLKHGCSTISPGRQKALQVVCDPLVSLSRARLPSCSTSLAACSVDQSDEFPDVAGRIQGARLLKHGCCTISPGRQEVLQVVCDPLVSLSRARLLFLQHSFLACSLDQSDGFPDVAGLDM